MSDDFEGRAARIRRTLSRGTADSGPARPGSPLDKLGDDPGAALHALRDYGLNDHEIGQYYGYTPATVRRLRHFFHGPGR